MTDETEPTYRDYNGNMVTLDKLCRDEPAWAANNIRWLLAKREALCEAANRFAGEYCHASTLEDSVLRDAYDHLCTLLTKETR